jgi:hypothetical protein
MAAPRVQDNDMRLAQFVTHSHVKHHPLNREALEDMAKANEACVLHTMPYRVLCPVHFSWRRENQNGCHCRQHVILLCQGQILLHIMMAIKRQIAVI